MICTYWLSPTIQLILFSATPITFLGTLSVKCCHGNRTRCHRINFKHQSILSSNPIRHHQSASTFHPNPSRSTMMKHIPHGRRRSKHILQGDRDRPLAAPQSKTPNNYSNNTQTRKLMCFCGTRLARAEAHATFASSVYFPSLLRIMRDLCLICVGGWCLFVFGKSKGLWPKLFVRLE